MLIKGSTLKVVDNSGPIIVKVIHLYTKKKFGNLSDLVLLTVKSYSMKKKFSSKIKINKKGSLVKGLICQVVSKIKRFDGTILRFSQNACILLSKNFSPIGTRFLSGSALELNYNSLSTRFLTMFPFVL